MNTLPRPRAILFDLGGTLLRQERWDPMAGTRAVLSLAKNPHGVTPEEVNRAVQELDADLQPRRALSMLEIPPWAVRRLVYERLRLEFAVSPQETEAAFVHAARLWTVEPGIHRALTGLAELRILMAVVSNTGFSGEALTSELEEHGLAHFFAFVMASADYVVCKPHPALFLTAAGKLDVPADRTWYIGDTPDADVAGALAAGMIAVLYSHDRVHKPGPEPNAVIGHWDELAGLIESAMRGGSE